jgi:aminoglycoside 6'-N-acetyltransferase
MPAKSTRPPAPLPVLQGERVRLRPAVAGDRQPFADILAQPSVRRWWNPGDPVALADEWLAADEDTTVFAIEAGGRVVGSIQFAEEPDPNYRSAGIDIFLGESAQDRGLGTDAIRTLARWLIEARGHARLTIDPAVANGRAIHVYTKVGFRPVGVMRSYETGPDGTRHDNLLMDLLAGELT